MHRVTLAVVLALLAALAIPLSSSAQSAQEFKAELHDGELCPVGIDLCGKGVVQGFGTVTTTLTFTSFLPGPWANCVTGTADRAVTLDRDGSTLLIAVVGTICDQKILAAFTILGGTGVFSGATGGGTFWGVTMPGPPADSVHYRGTITLP
jgi:hypothetical protein